MENMYNVTPPTEQGHREAAPETEDTPVEQEVDQDVEETEDEDNSVA